jgi:transcriptional regulator with XRE-family HTH domain
METADFAALLRELKDRSGLSYGTLAKRLHMSTSTLHRYCNGDAVPMDYAPVERFARLCKATPDELVEAHRRWIVADAARVRERKDAIQGATDSADTPEPAPEIEPGPEPDPGPGSVRRRRSVLVLAGVAVAIACACAALASNLIPGRSDGKDLSLSAASGTRTSATPTDAAHRSPSPSPSLTASPAHTAGGSSVSAAAAPLTVATRPYAWDSPCGLPYLVDRPPAEVPPPPAEQDAPGWVSALGGVSGGSQLLELTIQGTGKSTVVLEALHVRMVNRAAPLTWNAYLMGYEGVGCGGGVPTNSFGIDLDTGRPAATPESGQRDFPFKVSESDPEVFYITGNASSHDVTWYLELEWSSGGRHGILRIDNHGKPFRTSGMSGNPQYGYPLGGTKWVTHTVN